MWMLTDQSFHNNLDLLQYHNTDLRAQMYVHQLSKFEGAKY